MSPSVYIALVVVGAAALFGAIVWASIRYGRALQLAEDQAKIRGVERTLVDVVEVASRRAVRRGGGLNG